MAERTNPEGAQTSRATLSVVMTTGSRSSATLQAARVLAERCPTMQAQLIVVASGGMEPATTTLLESIGATIVEASATSTRAEMCDLGMRCASGAIVAVRDDVDVGDGRWLEAYSGILSRVETPVRVRQPERAVLETHLVRGAPLADVPAGNQHAAIDSGSMATGIVAAL